MGIVNLLPWWGWFLCGIASLFLARLAGRPADDYGSTTAEIIRMIAGFTGIVCIVIGVLAIAY
jgi:hypothetical protein